MMKYLLSVAFLSVSLTSYAEPLVLYDAGNTIDVQDIDPTLLNPIKNAVPIPDKLRSGPIDHSSDSKKELSMSFPLKVPGLAVGRINKYAADFPQLSSPVCVIGSDDKSLSWLVSYYDQLIQLKARCLLVQVDDQEQLARVAKFSKDIPVMPDIGGISIQLFKLKHYPVLVSNKWIEQ